MFSTWTRDKNKPLRRIWDATTPAVMAEQNIIAKLEEADGIEGSKHGGKRNQPTIRHRYRFHLFNRNTPSHETFRAQQEDTNEDPCVYIDERPRSGLLRIWKPSEDDEAPKFFGLFPLRQLFIPRIPYPLWDIHWDTAERDYWRKQQESSRGSIDTSNHSTSSVASKTKNERLVTRHIFLVRHGQYQNPHSENPKEEDLVLTDLGRAQARLTGQRLANFIAQNDAKQGPCTVKLLCTSELTRAKQTADIIERELHAMHWKQSASGNLSEKTDDDDYVVERCEPDPLLNEGVPCHHIPAENTEANQLGELVKAIDVDHPRIEEAFQKYIARSDWLEQKARLALAYRMSDRRLKFKRRNSDGGGSAYFPTPQKAPSTSQTPIVSSEATNVTAATDVTTSKAFTEEKRCQSEYNLKSLSKDFEDGKDDKVHGSGPVKSVLFSEDTIKAKEDAVKTPTRLSGKVDPNPNEDGDLNGRPGLQSMRSTHHLYNTLGTNIAKWVEAGSESERGNNFGNIDELTTMPGRHHEYEIIVTHANVIRYFLCRAWQVPPEAWLRFEILNGSITYMIVKGYGSAMCQMVGDTGHIPYSKISGDLNDGFSWEDKPVIKRTVKAESVLSESDTLNE